MKNRRPISTFAPQEVRRFVSPIGIIFILVMVFILWIGAFAKPAVRMAMIFYGVAGIGFVIFFSIAIARSTLFQRVYNWSFAIITGFGLGLLAYVLPKDLKELFHVMFVLVMVGVATISGRFPAYVTFTLALLTSLPVTLPELRGMSDLLEVGAPFLTSIVAMETYIRIQHTTQQHINRLETINKVSRQLMQSLDKEQVLALLSATMLDTLEADSYFIGLLQEENKIRLDLMYDDGDFYNGMELPLEGSLSGWVIKNQKELFLPDLREDVQLEGVTVRIIGKEKTSLSWLGVPLKAENITGIMAISSYQPNAFDLADLELLSSLAQHVTLALDNTTRHAQVEEQARLDSMTGVYNHGYFLKKLSEQAEAALTNRAALSLIMLDIDYFKQYNDTYGHLVGDNILKSLCTVIKHHIKQGDAVGRWGGEEFIISLPNATGEQALLVANRISETMALIHVEDREQKPIPVPTVSQGIAVFPSEENEIYNLIDLADRRLYVAKERGRNQIEPEAGYWANSQSEKN